MAIPENKEQISITLPKEVIKWAAEKAELQFKNRARFLSDIIITEYFKDIKKEKENSNQS